MRGHARTRSRGAIAASAAIAVLVLGSVGLLVARAVGRDAGAGPVARSTSPSTPATTTTASTSTSPSPSPSPSPGAPGPGAVAYARAGGVTLYLPIRGPALIGFHESLLSSALTLRPMGRLDQNDNPRYVPVPDNDGPSYVVMASRARPAAPTTSSDIVAPPGTTVRSPVTGTVVSVDDYVLYCEAADQRVLIRPDTAPALRVVLLHVQDVAVEPGQRVVAGTTFIGHPRIFYGSHPQFDQYVDGDQRHVHVEIDAEPNPPLPGC